MMGRYDEMSAWAKVDSLISNRVTIINQVMRCRFDGCVSNPCRRVMQGGLVTVSLCGCPLADYRLWDVGDARRALLLVEAAESAVWSLSRAGLLLPWDPPVPSS